jgi:hypothetical protein
MRKRGLVQMIIAQSSARLGGSGLSNRLQPSFVPEALIVFLLVKYYLDLGSLHTGIVESRCGVIDETYSLCHDGAILQARR